MAFVPRTLEAEAAPLMTEVSIQESAGNLSKEEVKDEELPLLHRTTHHPSRTSSISRLLNRTRHAPHLTSKTNFLRKSLLSLLTLLPSPFHHLLAPHTYPSRPTKFHPTAYLDGLRGIASWLVLDFHYTLKTLPEFHTYYGLSNDPEAPASSPLQLPFLRVLITGGEPAVHIFFVVSGVALSIKPVREARARDYASACATLSSSVFRRAIRLFFPMFVASFIHMLLIWQRWAVDNELTYFGDGFWDQFMDWVGATWEKLQLVWVWDSFTSPRYGGHTWTIMIEMGMSLLLFTVLLGLCRRRVPVRVGLLIVIFGYCFRCVHWAACEFVAGACIAELGLMQEDSAKVVVESSRQRQGDLETGSLDTEVHPLWSSSFPKAVKLGSDLKSLVAWNGPAICWLQLVFALYICGWPPNNVDKVWGLRYV